jgi:hypothetical protein
MLVVAPSLALLRPFVVVETVRFRFDGTLLRIVTADVQTPQRPSV